ncbi:MAG: 23S rRNA (uracil(1939)-C(5))-methyltransferase RlmD [Gammaproteobacteria bacterium]|nr:23S rRNA (uracil(1939)-C(5))-methyltransferase RlmD [Gammaproteobacteria bacterium]
MSRPHKKRLADPVSASIESLSHEGRGIARINGKTVFIDGALPGEEVRFLYTRRRGQFDEGRAVEVLEPSSSRVEPRCRYYGMCGGCSLMHLDSEEQILHKQSVLLEQLAHLGKVEPERILPPLSASRWGYRRKARLGAKYVAGKEKVLVGFREKFSSFIADIDSCEVLHPNLGEAIGQLKELIHELSVYRQIPQLEVAISDSVAAVVIRHLAPLTGNDKRILADFEAQRPVRFYLQPGGLDSVHGLSGDDGQNLYYRLDGHDITVEFSPIDFTQVNFELNALLVDRVIELLEPGAADKVLDLFCGLGNFTLPIARYAQHATGLESSEDLVLRAQRNARNNNLTNVDFNACNLMEPDAGPLVSGYAYNKVLLDPPRTGAREIIEQLDLERVDRLVYVSCNPATLARDAGILVKQGGLGLKAAGVMDMFPHTSHVESIALFE